MRSGQDDQHQDGRHGDGERLMKLEEHVGFNERAIEELSAEIAALAQRLAALNRRMDGLEGRLRRMAEGGEEAGEG